MKDREKGLGCPDRATLSQTKPEPKEQAKPKGESELSRLLDEKRLLVAWAPKGRDPESYPIEALKQIQSELDERIRRHHTTADYRPEDIRLGKVMKAYEGILVDKLYSLRNSIDTIRKAYEIITYPFCKNQELKRSIKEELELDDDITGAGKVELNEEELDVIGKMTTIRGLPFDPEKRVYEYEEVPDYTTSLFRRHVFH